MHNVLVILAYDGQPGRRIWRLQHQRPVGTVPVVVLRRRPEGPARGGRARRSAASPGTRPGPSEPSARRTRSPWVPAPACGAPRRPRERNTSSKLRANFASRSRMRNRTCRPRSPSTSRRLRACWVTQAPSGLAVTPARCTRRVSSSMKNSTYSRRSQTVSTVKKSQATIPAACWRRNACQEVPVRRGAGSSPCRRSDRADRGGRDPDAEPCAARLGCAGSPSAGSPWPGGRSAAARPRSSGGRPVSRVRVGPRAGDQPPVPAQQRSGLTRKHDHSAGAACG